MYYSVGYLVGDKGVFDLPIETNDRAHALIYAMQLCERGTKGQVVGLRGFCQGIKVMPCDNKRGCH